MNNLEQHTAHQVQTTASNVSFRNQHPAVGDSRAELLSGLKRKQKAINPKYFYDQQGSQLFDRITRLPEYYPTRAEIEILNRYKQEISAACGTHCHFIEPGSGSCEKARLLLDELQPSAYMPIDISADFLLQAATRLGAEYPWLTIQAVCSDFNNDWSFVEDLPAGKKVVFYPGSTIGNLEPADALDFLKRIRAMVGDDGGALIGVDLHKSSARLTAAYNDAEGVTAAFNLNVLKQINTLLDADFDPAFFSHHAFYNTHQRRIEMHLVSEKAQTVVCHGAGHKQGNGSSGTVSDIISDTLTFDQGETIHTESSYKYTLEGFAELAATAGLRLDHSWLDDERLFSVHYLSAA